jgi:hypothetical protein
MKLLGGLKEIKYGTFPFRGKKQKQEREIFVPSE